MYGLGPTLGISWDFRKVYLQVTGEFPDPLFEHLGA
jgi:hypothetical protein